MQCFGALAEISPGAGARVASSRQQFTSDHSYYLQLLIDPFQAELEVSSAFLAWELELAVCNTLGMHALDSCVMDDPQRKVIASECRHHPPPRARERYPRTQPPFFVVVSAKASILARSLPSRPGLPETTSRSSFGWFAGVKDRCTDTRPQSSPMSTRSFGHLGARGRRRQVEGHAAAGLAALLGVHLLDELLNWIALWWGLGCSTAHFSGTIKIADSGTIIALAECSLARALVAVICGDKESRYKRRHGQARRILQNLRSRRKPVT